MMENSYSIEYLDALLEGNRKKGSAVCHEYYHTHKDIKKVYEELMMPALYQIGKLWEHNKITVAAEHIATAITEAILNEFYSLIIPEIVLQKKMLAACVTGEYHQVGIKMVADIFELNGWDSHFLGANIPTKDLIKYSEEIQPQIIALSLSIYFHYPTLIEMIEQISSSFPEIRILIGGQGLNRGRIHLPNKSGNILLINNLNSVDKLIKTQL